MIRYYSVAKSNGFKATQGYHSYYKFFFVMLRVIGATCYVVLVWLQVSFNFLRDDLD